METYIGIVDKTPAGENFKFYFHPRTKIPNGQVSSPNDQEPQDLLPDITNQKICFYYDWYAADDLQKEMEKLYPDGAMVIFTFDKSILKDSPTVEYGQTLGCGSTIRYSPKFGYNVNGLDNEWIETIGNHGVYFAILQNELGSDFLKDAHVTVNTPCITAGSQVYVQWDDFWTGPYEIKGQPGAFYIEPEIKENNDTVLGFPQCAVKHQLLSYNNDDGSKKFSAHLLIPQTDNLEQRDVMTDDVLLKSFRESGLNGIAENDSVKREDIPALLKHFASSEIMESTLTAANKLDRLRRLFDILEKTELEKQSEEILRQQREKMAQIAFNGFLASKMLHAASEWEAEQSAKQDKDLTKQINNILAADKAPDKVVEYLCSTIKAERPTYSSNTILNIAICMTQGFLTVFSGEPGCGKTSICNLFGKVLGLTQLPQKRYLPVSVERGWTSKRDFIGYYNPLTKTFDTSNRRVFDALRQLDAEKESSKFPFVILLDEANLSPMEYYWSDFMNICDDLGPDSSVNLGEDYVFGIPETLHFVATINNDHTTETLSPRLIDRSWVITLPNQDICNSNAKHDSHNTDDPHELITWKSLQDAFLPAWEKCTFESEKEIETIYKLVVDHLKEQRFSVSPRIDNAIKRYWAAASQCFEEEAGISVKKVALDYAIAQRILPKITGNGDIFEEWLKHFSSLCEKNGLKHCETILKEMIVRGSQKMKYYEFFC